MATSMSLIMARRAAAALLAAIEVGNKVTMPYREETFCLLLLNSWEILLKSRIVQNYGENVNAIYENRSTSSVSPKTQGRLPRTIQFTRALGQAQVSANVYANLLGVNEMRNNVAHMGELSGEFKVFVLQFAVAAVENFRKLYKEWFGDILELPYMLPIAYIGKAQILPPDKSDVRQKQLIDYLSDLASSPDGNDLDHAVSLNIDVSINPVSSGGSAIGATNDPSAPQVKLTDTQLMDAFPLIHRDLVDECRRRYGDFKESRDFYNNVLSKIKGNPAWAFKRKLNPNSPKSAAQWRYKREPILEFLDTIYTKKVDAIHGSPNLRA